MKIDKLNRRDIDMIKYGLFALLEEYEQLIKANDNDIQTVYIKEYEQVKNTLNKVYNAITEALERGNI